MSIVKTPAVSQFYADLFLSIAKGMVTRPQDLAAGVEERASNGFPKFRVSAQCHIQDYGLLMGTDAVNARAFQTLLRAASTKIGEECKLAFEEPFGERYAYKPTQLDPNWNRDVEVGDLLFAVADDCWTGIIDATPRTEGGRTIVAIESEKPIPEEEFVALQTLMKAMGRSMGRSIAIELVK